MLIGLGLGPGDPELLTLKAVRILKDSDKVFVPGKLALELVLPYTDAEILDFPMTHDKTTLDRTIDRNADVVSAAAMHKLVAFGLIGDPNFFSTFTRLKRRIREKYPNLVIETVPGISSITAFASRTNADIDRSFVVSDGSPVATKIVLKARTPKKIRDGLIEEGYRNFIFAEKLFSDEDYFSILCASKGDAEEGQITPEKVYFVGAGPGDPKLITLRGKELLEKADLVIYTGSLVDRKIAANSRGEIINSHGLTLDRLTDLMVGAIRDRKTVVRLHTGDPSLYGAICEQIAALKSHNIDVEIIPGVSSVFAASAALQTQLTLSGITETLIITRPAGETLEADSIRELSKHGATMAIFLGVNKIAKIMDEVEYPPETPVAVVYRASWQDEQIIRGTVADIAEKVEAAGIERSAMILIGDAVHPKSFRRSHLYG
jgi:precorrin-4/cobalt-precorrin-4 C11-methyltransferase